jgi:hypothetical protein
MDHILLDNHWHVQSGLTGYGPDASDTGGFNAFTDARAIADQIVAELQVWAQSERDSADALADSGDYQGAWRTLKHSDQLHNLADNFNNDRANAPLYVGDPVSWEQTIMRMVGEHFPIGVDPSYGVAPTDYCRSMVYVWECVRGGCEATHDTDE